MSSLKIECSPTLSQKKFLERVWDNPTTFFNTHPLDWVREECLKALKSGGFYLDNSCGADWAESYIRYFLKKNTGESEKGFQILSWYLFCNLRCTQWGLTTPYTVRAIEFAVQLANDPNLAITFRWKISKDIAGRLNKDDGKILYPMVKGIKEFLRDLIIEIWPGGIKRRIWFQDNTWPIDHEVKYLENSWINLERAMKVIQNVEDFSFISLLEQTLILHEDGSIHPEYGPSFQKRINQVILSETIRNLKAVCKQKIRDKHAGELERALAKVDSSM